MRPTNTTLGQGFFPDPTYASRLGKSPARPIANATRETPNRSERASLKVVSNAPADTITGPIPLPRANKVAASSEADCAVIKDVVIDTLKKNRNTYTIN